jgi:hypothetical protein
LLPNTPIFTPYQRQAYSEAGLALVHGVGQILEGLSLVLRERRRSDLASALYTN